MSGRKPKVAIVGGGFTALAAAILLIDKGIGVEIIEAEDRLGGLAKGFNPGNWDWDLDMFYHHVFTNDADIISLADKVNWPVQIHSPVTSSFINGNEEQLDSPITLLKFKELSFLNRIWMGMGLAVLKLIPNGLFLEKYRVVLGTL